MFEAFALVAVFSLVFGIIVDDEFYRFANTLANMATVFMLVYHQRRVKREIEPEVKKTAAVVSRQLGERRSGADNYKGPERRKSDPHSD